MSTPISRRRSSADSSPARGSTVRVDAFGGRRFDGVVRTIAPASGAEFSLLPPDNATGNFTKIVQRMPVRIGSTDAPSRRALAAAGPVGRRLERATTPLGRAIS